VRRIDLWQRHSATHLSFRISRYGVTSSDEPGLPSGLPSAVEQEGFPDMSRTYIAPRGTTGQVELTRQGISLRPVTSQAPCSLLASDRGH